MLLKTVKDPSFWKKVQTDDSYAQILNQIKQNYTDSRWDEIPSLKYRPRMRFYRDGDRHEFEEPYFRRRRYLASAALLTLIYPEEQRYLNELQECIWSVCEDIFIKQANAYRKVKFKLRHKKPAHYNKGKNGKRKEVKS